MEYYAIDDIVYLIESDKNPDHHHVLLWKHMIKFAIKQNKQAINLAEILKNRIIAMFASIHYGLEEFEKILNSQNEEKIYSAIYALTNLEHGEFINILITNEINMSNVLYMLKVCLEILRRIQFTKDLNKLKKYICLNPDVAVITL